MPDELIWRLVLVVINLVAIGWGRAILQGLRDDVRACISARTCDARHETNRHDHRVMAEAIQDLERRLSRLDKPQEVGDEDAN